MKTLARRTVLALILFAVPALAGAQAMSMPMQGSDKPIPSPPATATATIGGGTVTIKYSAPSVRGRKIMGGLVPYGQVWRTGANSATTLITTVDLLIGKTFVPAGTYTLFTLPVSATEWQLIISKKTGEWGIPYPEGNDLGRSPMKAGTLSVPQETMSISLEDVKPNSAELHVKWENTDVSVPVMRMKMIKMKKPAQ